MSEAATLFDFVIIGAGIAGASLACRLAPHGRIALLERESQPGYHSTGRSAALFTETYGSPMIRALTRASRAFYEQPPAGFCTGPILTPRGVMHVARVGEETELEAACLLAREASDDAVRISADEAVAHVPVLHRELLCGALLEPAAKDMDVHVLHQGFLRGARAGGCLLLNDAHVVSGRLDGEQWRIVLADGRTLRARTIVNASGAWADETARSCGVSPVGLQPKRRTAFTFDAPPELAVAGWPTVIGIDESYYFKPDAGQLLGSPANADPVEPHDVQAEELDVATGIHHIEMLTSLRIRRPRRIWAGLRSFVADGDLVIGADDRCPRFFWLAAQGGYGIQTADAASRLATAQLLGQPLPGQLAEFGVRAAALSPARLR